MKILFKKGNMFENLRKDVVYLHSCNAQGHWGAGIALEFRDKFKKAYLDHKKIKNSVGDGYILKDGDYSVACLITSKFYGQFKDPPKKILVQTYTALENMLRSVQEKDITVYSPKINSGYFATPWEATEKVIRLVCGKSDKNITWVIWEL